VVDDLICLLEILPLHLLKLDGCTLRLKAPLLTLDRRLKATAQNLNIETMEI